MATQSSENKPTKSAFLPPVAVLLIVTLLAVVGGYGTYTFVLSKKSSTSQTVADIVTNKLGNAIAKKLSEGDFTNISDPLIRKHFAAQFSVPASRITSTSDGMGASSSTIMEMQLGDGTNYGVHMTQVQGGKTALETITIGEKMYVKDLKDGKWWVQNEKPTVTKAPVKNSEEPEKYNPVVLKEKALQKTETNYRKLGEEKCGSLQCYKYEEKSSESDSPTRTFWFDNKDYLLRKEQNGYGEFTSESEYSYDNVSVKAPSNTKEVPDGKDINEMMVSGMMGAQGLGNEYEELKKLAPSKEELESLQNSWSNGNTNSDELPQDAPSEETL